MSKYSKAVAGVIAALGAAVAQGLLVGRGAAAVAVVSAFVVGAGIYKAPANTE